MITILGIMDKLYSDTKALMVVYFVGTGLLLLFIVMLAFSLRKKDNSKSTDKKEEINNIEEEKNVSLFDNDEKKEEVSTKEEVKEFSVKIEETAMDNTQVEPSSVEESKSEDEETTESLIEATQKLNITPMTFDNEVGEFIKEETIKPFDEEVTKPAEKISNFVDNNVDSVKENNHVDNVTSLEDETLKNVDISTEIPDVDSFVDKVVNKTVEKNEQFSSIFVGDKTSTMKLDTVLDKLNVDKDIKEDVIPKDTTLIKEEIVTDEKPVVSSLDDLKKSLDVKKEEITSKEEELKNKLNSLKNTSSNIEVPKINE